MLWRIPADTHGQRIGTMARRGPFTTCKPEYCSLAHEFCLLGATNDELARLFEVAPRTTDRWIAGFPEFPAAVEEGRAVADANVAERLYARTLGCSHPAVKIDGDSLLLSFGKTNSKKLLDRTEQCCGVSLPTLT
jgi:hypothetical protein